MKMKIAFSLWQFCGYLITLSYERVGYRTGFIFYFFECLRDRKISSATHHSALGKKTLLEYFCQLEIDQVTQQPKETCQRTCRGP